jgi:hypothetical protein
MRNILSPRKMINNKISRWKKSIEENENNATLTLGKNEVEALIKLLKDYDTLKASERRNG